MRFCPLFLCLIVILPLSDQGSVPRSHADFTFITVLTIILENNRSYIGTQQKKTVVAFIVGAFDAAWSKVEHKPVHSRNLVLQEGTSGCSPDIFQAISSPHQ